MRPNFYLKRPLNCSRSVGTLPLCPSMRACVHDTKAHYRRRLAGAGPFPDWDGEHKCTRQISETFHDSRKWNKKWGNQNKTTVIHRSIEGHARGPSTTTASSRSAQSFCLAAVSFGGVRKRLYYEKQREPSKLAP